VLHRTRLAHDFDAFGAEFITGFVDVRHTKPDMAKIVPNFIRVSVCFSIRIFAQQSLLNVKKGIESPLFSLALVLRF
jgi:hypothetical protein